MGAPLDPSGFQINAVIKTTDGGSVNLWMNTNKDGVDDSTVSLPSSVGGLSGMGGGSESLADLSGMDLPYLESVDVEITLGLSARITASVAAPFDIGLMLLDTSLFQVGNFIEVQIGYPRLGRFTPWVSAMMSKPSIRINGDEGLTVTINGDGGSFASLRGVSSEVFSGKSYRDIIQTIAERHKWGVVFPESGSETPLNKTREAVSQENQSDWFFIQKLARASACDVFLGPDDDGKRTLFVLQRKDALRQQPGYRFLMRGSPDFDKSFPILNFESEAEGVWLPGAAISTRSSDLDPDTGALIDELFTAETTQEPSLGDTGVPGDTAVTVEGEQAQLSASGGDSQRSGVHLPTSARDPRGIEDLAQAHRDESAIRGGINASISSYGIPELFPGDVVEVLGLGIFNSNYYVHRLTWSANVSEFTMRLMCINNATASGIVDNVFLNPPTSSNTEQVPEGLPSDSGASLLVEAEEIT